MKLDKKCLLKMKAQLSSLLESNIEVLYEIYHTRKSLKLK